MKLRRKLIYSALLFLLATVLLIVVTLGWFIDNSVNDVNGISLYQTGVSFSFFQSTDTDLDGQPDLDSNNQIIYAVQNPENVVLSNIYPGYAVAYRIKVDANANLDKVNLVFQNITPPDGEGVDVTKAIKIKYTDPQTHTQVDTLLFNLLDGSRNAAILTDFTITGNDLFTFDYTVYMDPNAGNTYKNKTLVINSIQLYITH